MCEVLLGDETGLVNAYIPKARVLVPGSIIVFHNAYSHVHKEHIQLQMLRNSYITSCPQR